MYPRDNWSCLPRPAGPTSWHPRLPVPAVADGRPKIAACVSRPARAGARTAGVLMRRCAAWSLCGSQVVPDREPLRRTVLLCQWAPNPVSYDSRLEPQKDS